MQDNNRLHLAIIIGSTRKGRFAPTVAGWFAGQAERRDDMAVDVIDLAGAQLPDVLSDKPGPQVAAVTPRLAAADAFVVVTPEYNHSFPAPLKNAIDWHFKEWQAKPVGFVSYGAWAEGCGRWSTFVRCSRNCTPSPFATRSASTGSGRSSTPMAGRRTPASAKGRPNPCSTSSRGGPMRYERPGLGAHMSSDARGHGT